MRLSIDLGDVFSLGLICLIDLVEVMNLGDLVAKLKLVDYIYICIYICVCVTNPELLIII